MPESMEEAHRRDSQTERLMRDAKRAIDDVLNRGERVSSAERVILIAARDVLERNAAHIVAVWD